MSTRTIIEATAAVPVPAPETVARFIARQPIFDRQQNTFGYELLFRDGLESYFCAEDPDVATCSTIDFSLLFGASALTAGRPAFVNCTRNLLLRDTMTVLPRDLCVVELLETISAESEVIAACGRLRSHGYTIALDDYVPNTRSTGLLAYADMVKVDFLSTDPSAQAAIANEMKRRGIRLVAEKIESREQFHYAHDLGYDLFQGYFFCRPETIIAKDIPCSQPGYFHVMQIAFEPQYNVEKLETAILQEPALCYRLLRYLNCAAFGLFPVRSIRHALSLMGQRETQKWISVVVCVSFGRGSDELIATALTRARHCESMASSTTVPASEAFMAGLFSLVDAILDRPLDIVLSQLPLTVGIKDALRGTENTLRHLLNISLTCERGDWSALGSAGEALGMSDLEVWDAYTSAREWAMQLIRARA